jgi:ABC-2 type transport system permease protein
MFKLILKKETLSTVRDRRIQISSILLMVLMMTAVLVGKEGQRKAQAEREAAQSEMYQVWLNQGEKHPHSAAHFGQFAFKPQSVLSFMDTGLDPYTGISVFLEAHRQHEILYSRAQDSNSLVRYGELTSAMIFKMLIPLLIIFMAFNSFSKEREQGTLKLVYSQGLSARNLVLGKTLSTFIVILALFLPIVILAYFLLASQSGIPLAQETWKLVAMMLGYTIYFFVLTLLAVLISAFSKSSGGALLSLIGIWALFCIILPKATASLADRMYPTPSQFEFRNTIAEKVRNGVDGHNPSDQRLTALREQILDDYGVETIEELPVNWGGIALQAGEEYTDMVYDEEFSNVEEIFLKQNEMVEWTSLLNPYLAIRNLSMGFSGTNFENHVTFSKAAENYRRDFVKKMNKDMELNHKPGVAYGDYNVGIELWSSITPFSYDTPNVSSILASKWRSILSLSVWTLLLMSIVYTQSDKISILQQ